MFFHAVYSCDEMYFWPKRRVRSPSVANSSTWFKQRLKAVESSPFGIPSMDVKMDSLGDIKRGLSVAREGNDESVLLGRKGGRRFPARLDRIISKDCAVFEIFALLLEVEILCRLQLLRTVKLSLVGDNCSLSLSQPLFTSR